MFNPYFCVRAASAGAAFFCAFSLTGCYVVPIDPRTGYPATQQTQTVPGAVTAPVAFPARLYPANDLASRYGLVTASVTNDLNGRGVFNAVINGEAFVGEATRRSGPGRAGTASGAGNRGSFLSCEYTLNSATQGTGQCKLSDGAIFSMHLGN